MESVKKKSRFWAGIVAKLIFLDKNRGNIGMSGKFLDTVLVLVQIPNMIPQSFEFFPLVLHIKMKKSMADSGDSLAKYYPYIKCPQADSNRCLSLERAPSWATRRWGLVTPLDSGQRCGVWRRVPQGCFAKAACAERG
jgi:hypothetical protein